MTLSADRQRLLEQLIRGERTARAEAAPAAASRVEPASFAQRRLWFIEQLQQTEVPYTLHAVQLLEFEVDAAVLERAVNGVVARHEILRVGFLVQDGEPMQRVESRLHVPLKVVDLTSLPAAGRQEEARRRMGESVARRFDLGAAPLLRIELFRLATAQYVLLFAVHHIIFDGPSFHVFFHEVASLYDALLQGVEARLPAVVTQYPQFARAQRARLTPQRVEEELRFWRAELDAVSMLDLPTDRTRAAVPTFRGAAKSVELPAGVVSALQQYAAAQKTSLFSVTLAGLFAALSRLSGQTDFAIGLPVTGRDSADRLDAIGFFVDTVVIRAPLRDDPTPAELARRTHAALHRCLAHASLPFEMLVEHLRPARSFGVNPFFQVGYQLMLQPAETIDSRGFDINRSSAMFDIGLDLWLQKGVIKGRLQYNTDLFDEATIDLIIAVFRRALDWIMTGNESLSRFSIAARALGIPGSILRGDSTVSRGSTCLALIADVAAANPDAVALEAGAVKFTYRQMSARVTGLAAILASRGVSRGGVVALQMRRSPELILLQLAVMQLGAAFVYLDPEFPASRRAAILEQAQPQALVDESWSSMEESPATLPGEGPGESDPAYVIFTSGTTGIPKGVLIEHRGLVEIVLAQRQLFALGVGRRVAQLASPTFDAAIFETLLALASGATLVVAPPTLLVGADLARFLGENRIDTLVLPPSLLTTLRPADCPMLRTICVAGESCAADLAARWREGREFWNLYGPTETSIWATYGRATIGARVSIGRPIAGVTTLVVDDELRVLPVGVPGALCISGVTLARGYVGQEALTAQRFLDHTPEHDARVYLTGDRVRQTEAGELVYLGRADRQLKIRGFRIEPEEIEAVLRSHAEVEDAVVAAHALTDGDRVLVAYLQSKTPASRLADECRALVAARLPHYAVPGHFMVLATFPRTVNGKLDLNALPSPEEGTTARADFVEPSTPTERAVSELMARAVHAPRLGAADDFFHVGGHSLAAAHLATRLRQAFNVDVTIRDVFVHSTVAALAARVDELARSGARADLEDDVPLVRLPRTGDPARKDNPEGVPERPGAA